MNLRLINVKRFTIGVVVSAGAIVGTAMFYMYLFEKLVK